MAIGVEQLCLFGREKSGYLPLVRYMVFNAALKNLINKQIWLFNSDPAYRISSTFILYFNTQLVRGISVNGGIPVLQAVNGSFAVPRLAAMCISRTESLSDISNTVSPTIPCWGE